jgi:hypothetical protein
LLDAGGVRRDPAARVTLPTGENQPAAGLGTLANLLAMPDLYSSRPRSTTLELGASPVLRAGPVFARFDLGLDWNLDVKTMTVGKALHGNLGVGADLGAAAVMRESANATLFSDRPSVDRATIDAFAISARLDPRAASPCRAGRLPDLRTKLIRAMC